MMVAIDEARKNCMIGRSLDRSVRIFPPHRRTGTDLHDNSITMNNGTVAKNIRVCAIIHARYNPSADQETF
jgi:hypothetical protein